MENNYHSQFLYLKLRFHEPPHQPHQSVGNIINLAYLITKAQYNKSQVL